MKAWTLPALMCLLLSAPALATDADIDFYGYVKVDAAYDNALSQGNFMLYVRPQAQGVKIRTFNLTARQTRLGMRVNKNRAEGIFEIDFYGGGTENKNALALRKAYVDVPIGTILLRAGQAVDIISPLNPHTFNYTVAYAAGNIGYRRPLIAAFFTRDAFTWAIAAARSIGDDLNGDGIADGEASALPTLQSRLSLKRSKSEIGISAHYGFMDAPGAASDTYKTWSANLDLNLPLTTRLTLQAEAYTGVNTAAYYGAVLNRDCVQNLKSRGGWINARYAFNSPFALSLGGGLDDLCNAESTYMATLTDARTRNAHLFGQVTYAISPSVQTGLEISHWTTYYRNPSPENDPNPSNLRVQWAIQSNF